MKPHDFDGVHTALITPMQAGQICYKDTEKLVEDQIAAGISGLVAVGTTGESPTLHTEEHIAFIRFVAAQASGRLPVIAGTGSNSTDEAIDLVRCADKAGADAHLQVAPYYNKPSQEGLFQHFSAIAEVTEKPIILYSIPGRCGIAIEVDTVARLYEKYPHVCAIKEAGGSCDRVSKLYQKLGADYCLLSGDDSLTLPFITCGATGVVSVASNVIPSQVVQMVSSALKGNWQEAIALNHKLYPLFRDLFIEPNPVPCKYLMHRRGIISSPEVKLPLCPLSASAQAQLNDTWKALSIG